jgi:heptosyltransferase-1
LLQAVPGPRLAINVGARWLTKRWPPGHFAAVARRAALERGAGLVLVGSPEDRPLVDELKAGLGPIPSLDLCGRTTLPKLAAVASKVDVFLSNDTGPLHLASATGTKVLGVYTCTSPSRTGPYGPNARSIASCVWCAPSYVKTCPRLECMTELRPEKVWRALVAQLDEGEGSLRIA